MAHSFGFRTDHLLPFMTYANLVNIDPRDIYQLGWTNCLRDPYQPSCGVSWTEYAWQIKDRPSRMSLAQNLAQAERMIGNYLKSPVGPTYIHGEMHTVQFHSRHRSLARYNFNSHTQHQGVDLKIKTNYRNVLKTGTQVLTSISRDANDLPRVQTREFIDRRGWNFSEDIIYCIGSADEPLLIADLETDEVDNLCNLRIYQEGFGPLNDGCEPLLDAEGNICYVEDWTSQTPQFYHGHRIRPFHATYNGERLCIQINKTPNVRLELYSHVPQGPKGIINDLDFCDEDNFPERLEIYNVSYEKPDGVAYLRKQPCACSSGCDVCEMREVPICLEPIDPIEGEFRVIPIQNTAEDDEPCCWERTTWTECCYDLYGDYTGCGCDIPVVVCINYLASHCGNWNDCCFPDTVCPELAPSVAFLATGMFPTVCNCGCFDDIFEYYSKDLMLTLAGMRAGSVIYQGEAAFQVFGSTRGAYEAYNHIRYIHRIKPLGDYFVG